MNCSLPLRRNAREELIPLVAQHGALVAQILEPNVAEQEWLLQMHRWRQVGSGYGRIASELNRLNIPTKTGLGSVIAYKGAKRFSRGLWQCGNGHKVLNGRSTQDRLKQLAA